MSLHNHSCFANHMGVWLMQPTWLQQAVGAIKSGVWKPAVNSGDRVPYIAKDGNLQAAITSIIAGKVVVDPMSGPNAPNTLYTVTNDGIAVISLEGPMMKFDSKYGSANTMRARRALRAAVADTEVTAIMLYIDSPGGHVAGTMELADEIRAAGKSKLVHAHADDLVASAAYWAASAASKISINQIGEAGSIGTVGVIEDWSKAYAEAGVTVHVISTGSMKGAFTEGTAVTPEQLAYLQKLVNEVNTFFLAAVQKGRGISAKALGEIADGRVFMAAEAQSLGLVDAVQSFDRSMADLKKASTSFISQAKAQARGRQAIAELEIESAE